MSVMLLASEFRARLPFERIRQRARSSSLGSGALFSLIFPNASTKVRPTH